MKYHKKLKRTDLNKYDWRTILKMAASEFSRADSLKKNEKDQELANCLLRAKELFGVLEIDPAIPQTTAIKLLLFTQQLVNPLKVNANSMYKRSMALAS